MTENVDEIGDYDYFEHKRNAHLERLKLRKADDFAIKRHMQKAKSLAWRKDGDQALSALTGCVASLKSILIPHNNMKLSLTEFSLHALATNDLKSQRNAFNNNRRYSAVLLGCVNPPMRRYKIRYNLVRWKVAVMQSVRLNYIIRHPFSEQFTPLPIAWRTFRILFREFMRYVPIAQSISSELIKKRAQHRKAKAKMELILETQRKCRYIYECRSMQHSNPKGCAHCGVIYIGGILNAKDKSNYYVTSVSRETGVPTLVTLDFELDSLAAEEVAHREVLREVYADLAAFESVVMATVAVNIQRWWGIVLAWKKLQRKEQRRAWSLYWHRIRRLSKMKRELDELILEAAPIDAQYTEDKYCDVIPELREYVAFITEKKRLRMLRWARRFHVKLSEVVARARHIRYLESLKVKPMVVVEKPVVLRMPKPVDKRQFVCYRQECQMRRFLTAERYDTHMSVHRQEDSVRYAKYERNRQAKLVRCGVEKEFLARVRDSRQYLQQTNQFELADYSVDAHFDRIVNPPKDDTGAKDCVNNLTSSQPSSPAFKPRRRRSSLMGTGYDFDAARAAAEAARIKAIDPEEACLPPLILPRIADYAPDTMSPSSLPWTAMPHLHGLNSLLNSSQYCLEMVSRQADVDIPSRVTLDRPVVRVGTHSSCECIVRVSGAAEREGKIASVHCLLYCSMTGDGGGVTLVDNSSAWGTYMVSATGTRKVPTKVTAGVPLTPGLLVCIGVCRNGPRSLSATEANSACVVYRVRCLDLEG